MNHIPCGVCDNWLGCIRSLAKKEQIYPLAEHIAESSSAQRSSSSSIPTLSRRSEGGRCSWPGIAALRWIVEIGIGGYFCVKFPDYWPLEKQYEFNWHKLQYESDPFETIDYAMIT